MVAPMALVLADALLAAADGSIAAVAFLQLLRTHFRNRQVGWTRQKIFYLMIGSSNIGYLIYFLSSLVAACEGWQFWLNTFGFVLIAAPQILFLAAFLLLLSFWVDLCHQAKDDEEDDENCLTESFLEKEKNVSGTLHADGWRRCCSFRNIHVGSRQKFVILVIILIFILMIAFALLIWVGRGENPIDSSLMARVYQDIISVAMLILGGAFACYGLVLFSKMSKVRSEMASTEMWKVASLAAVTLVCFTSSSVLALFTDISVLYNWHADDSDPITSSVFIFLYYLVGSSVPSGVVLWIMREMPPQVAADRLPESRVVTYVRDSTVAHNPQWRTTVASSLNKALKSSPI
ncbi:tobamovirus multiplication protein 1 [Iris pallida]|uniref:Tobamovirus multiplication protein 1 n=1 Tax=Iris pallida TaxID=29817 RepID=A0AAX6EGS4_IRIPA|nr:tobamovirus multiplication protein 1 [Iris pallida]KAJ6842353.1 tobamovirus multiplication protein 1 [Iris pallida]